MVSENFKKIEPEIKTVRYDRDMVELLDAAEVLLIEVERLKGISDYTRNIRKFIQSIRTRIPL